MAFIEALRNMLIVVWDAYEEEEHRENDHGYRVFQARCPAL